MRVSPPPPEPQGGGPCPPNTGHPWEARPWSRLQPPGVEIALGWESSRAPALGASAVLTTRRHFPSPLAKGVPLFMQLQMKSANILPERKKKTSPEQNADCPPFLTFLSLPGADLEELGRKGYVIAREWGEIGSRMPLGQKSLCQTQRRECSLDPHSLLLT